MSETLPSAERSAIVAELRRSRDAFVAALSAIPAHDWARRPAADRWAASECAEHVIKIERGMRKFLPSAFASATPDPARRGALAARDPLIIAGLRGGPARLAPENVRPEGRYNEATPEQAAADFAHARDEIIRLAERTETDLRSVFVAHPALKEIDGCQWFLFAAYHTDRHTRQLEALRAELAG